MKQQPSFIGKDDLSKRITNFVKSENKRRKFRIKNELFQPEYVTQCERRIVYRTLGYKPEIQIETPNLSGIKGKWLSMFMQMDDVTVVSFDHFVSDINNHIFGKIDLILNFENADLKTICMIRAVDDDVFTKIQDNGALRKDVLADMLYMWLSEVPNAIMIYENLKNEDFEIFHLIPHNEYINSAKEKYHDLIPFKLQGKLPERPKRCTSSDSKECAICEFRKQCWE